MSELNSGLRTKLSIDEEFVSINALELFTRDQGLTKALTNLVQECVAQQKEQLSSQINDTIVSELAEVKQMLDQKSKQLSQQEKTLQKKEKNFDLFKLEWVRKIDAEYQSLCKKQELKMQKEVQSLNKKIN